MSSKKYYKFIWDYCNENFDDGGKYLGCEYGVLFASSNNKIFKLALKCKKICDDNNITGDTFFHSFQYKFGLERMKTGQQSCRLHEIAKNESFAFSSQ